MAERYTRIGFWTAVTLVALRMVIGWHFFTEGVKKLEPGFTSAGFLRSANGPFAEFYRSYVPSFHDWRTLADQPLPSDPDEITGEQNDDGVWQFPTNAYGPWASRIAADWTDATESFKNLPEMTEEQQQRADALLEDQLERLAAYFHEHRSDILDYQHEVRRAESLREKPGADELPYLHEHADQLEADARSAPAGWARDLEAEQRLFVQDLQQLLSEEQQDLKEDVARLFDSPSWLPTIDLAVTCLTVGVGVCLLIGLATRLAAFVAGTFLLSVMITQPPWDPNTIETAKIMVSYQAIEVVALLVLMVIGAGRWFGIDAVIGHFWRNSSGEAA